MTSEEVVSDSFPPSQHPWQVPCLGLVEIVRLAPGKGEDLPDSRKGPMRGGLAMELARDRKEEKGRLSLGCVPAHLPQPHPYVTM